MRNLILLIQIMDEEKRKRKNPQEKRDLMDEVKKKASYLFSKS